MFELVAAVVLVLVASGLCSGVEAALFTIPRLRVKQHEADGRRGAKALVSVKERISRPIAAIVILNNIANIGGSIMVGSIAAKEFGSDWLGLVSAVLTVVVIIFAEVVPKTVGERYCDNVSLWASPFVLGLVRLFFPMIWMMERITEPLSRGGKPVSASETQIRLLASMGQKEGAIEEDESWMINRVFQMNDKTAGQIMSPRTVMSYLGGDTRLGDHPDCIKQSPHSRIVIIGEEPDDILGIALKNELLCGLLDGRTDALIREFASPVASVPGSQTSDDLLRSFQASHHHLAIVRDEFGGVMGVVTLEDVLEVLTGEIVDETDRTADLQELGRRKAARILAPEPTLSEEPPTANRHGDAGGKEKESPR